MTNHQNPTQSLDRRTALGGIAALAATASFLGAKGRAAAQDALPDYSGHPLCGMWLAIPNAALPTSPMFVAPSHFTPDGYIIFAFPPVDLGENGLFYQSGFFGTWAPVDDNRGRWHGVSMSSDANGAFTGSTELDTIITVLDDGTFIDDGRDSRVTIRDPFNNVVFVIEPTGEPNGRPPVTARKMTIDDAGFPAPPSAATPTT